MLVSQLVCSSPRLIAAYHVLRRLPVPRHPPCALTRLISLRCLGVDSSTLQHTTRQLSKSKNTKCPMSNVQVRKLGLGHWTFEISMIERGKCGRLPKVFRSDDLLDAPERR